MYRRRTLILLVCCALLHGCKKEAAEDNTSASKTLGPDGGRLELGDGARVHIPQGALPIETSVTITRLPDTIFPQTTFIPISHAYSLSPHGQIFFSPVTVYLPYDPVLAGENAALVRIFLSADNGVNWNQLPFVQSAYTALVGGHTTHFSIVVAGIPLRDDSEGFGEGGEEGEEGGGKDPPSGSPDGCTAAETPGCNGCDCEESVCSLVSGCCLTAWNEQCVQVCMETGGCQGTPEPEGGGGEGGSCVGVCGDKAPEGCFCDGSCVNFGDCCTDACSLCGHCGGPSCGDGECASDEDCQNCPADCGPCGPVCGNGVCESSEGCSSCPEDCGACYSTCGDGKCTGAESCDNCISDCGPCGNVGTCLNSCGLKASGGCYCDSECSQFNDCCTDVCASCGFCS